MKKIVYIAAFLFSATVYAQTGTTVNPVQVPVSDQVTIYLSRDSSCSFFIGFENDYDRINFSYAMKTDGSSNVKNFKIALYDIWGRPVYEGTASNNTWYMTETDQYYWMMTYEDANGSQHTYCGQVYNPWYRRS